ncbi:MAG: mercuric transport protein MerTP [Bacteroidales bacterium]|nr:mercuric transport protein MerTP [Bacteroidales bacterium]
MQKDKKLISVGLLTAIASSLCCITPILALISGTSGIASTFSWTEPFRPYLIVITILVLAFAWYQKLKPKKEIKCDCEVDEKPKFMQTKLFLGLVTGFAVVMLAFPYYSSIFYSNNNQTEIITEKANIQTVEVGIEGMTCDACQNHINHAVNELPGIIKVTSSYQNANAVIEFDKTKTNLTEIKKSINSTGYKTVNNQ